MSSGGFLSHRKMETLTTDVAVIGAGLSGLSAAYYLISTDKSLQVTVLEAKDRIGGRTYSTALKTADGNKDYYDLGGEWVARPQPHLHYLLQKFNQEVFNPQLLHRYIDGGEIVLPPLSLLSKLDLLLFSFKLKWLKKKYESEEELCSTVDALQSDGMTFQKFMMANLWTEGAKSIVAAAVRNMFGYTPDELSLLYFIMYIDIAGGLSTFLNPSEYIKKESRVKGGIAKLSSLLWNRIGKKNIILNRPVTHIVQMTKDKVIVVTDKRLQVNCSRVIVAIPPHLAAEIIYSPELPSTKMTFLKNVPLAFIIKFCITYEEAFWRLSSLRQADYGFQSVIKEPDCGPVGVVYDGTSATGNPALVGFVSASRGSVGQETNPEDRRDVLLNLLQVYLGSRVRNYLDFRQKDWSEEPYNGGCFLKSLVPGSTRYFSQHLREPFDRIHFAGTETATVWCGFMNGAVQSGFRAAIEVLSNVRPKLNATRIEDEMLYYHTVKDNSPSTLWPWFAVLAGLGCLAALYVATYKEQMLSDPKIIYIGILR